MTEILFYHLKGQTPEQVLPALLQKSLERGWRVVVQASSDERVEALDAHLWTWRDDAFLPHGTWRDAEAAEQPIVLTVNDENPNRATVRFLVDGANLASDAAGYERIVLLFDGDDPDAVDAARARWSEAKAAGIEATYWQADEQGRWRRQGLIQSSFQTAVRKYRILLIIKLFYNLNHKPWPVVQTAVRRTIFFARLLNWML